MKLWIEGALHGEPEAYEQLVTHFYGMALAVAYQQLKDMYGAEDVVQEAFTEAFANLIKLDKPEAFPGWFKTIVERQCYRWLRRKRHSLVPIQEIETIIREKDQSSDPEARAIQKELHQTLRSSIAQLPSQMQVVVDLFYFQGYSLKEISEFLEVNVSALKKRLFDARAKLKRSLPVQNLAIMFNELHEGGVGMLHIMNGDHAANRLRESGIQGDILVWRELYTYGPVTTDMKNSTARQHRAAVLENELGIPQKEYLQIEALEEKLRSLQQYQEIVLWFEYDLYDQTMLSYLLYYLSRQDLQNIRLNLLCIDSYPEVEQFRGLGQLTSKQIGSLSGSWHVIEERELRAGKQFWEAYTSSDIRQHQQYLQSGTNELPFAKAAFESHLSRLPSVTNGLGSIEQATLQAISAGVQHPHDLFREVGDSLHILGLGDLEYWAHLKRIAEGPTALIRMKGASSFPKYSLYDQAFRDAVLSLTDLGVRVLKDEVNWSTLREDEYWVGGIHVKKGIV